MNPCPADQKAKRRTPKGLEWRKEQLASSQKFIVKEDINFTCFLSPAATLAIHLMRVSSGALGTARGIIMM